MDRVAAPKLFHGLKPKIYAVVVGFIAFTLATYVMFYHAVEEQRLHQGWVTHTHEVISQSEALLGHIRDAETGQRGYLLTGDTSYLEPYHTGIRETGKTWQKLKDLTGDNTGQQDLLVQIHTEIQYKFDELAQTIRLARQGDRAGALKIVNTDAGKLVMEGIRDNIRRFEQAAQALLAERSLRYQQGQKNLGFLLFVIFAAIIFCGFIIIYYVDYSIVGPLSSLISRARDMAAGRKVAPFNVRTADEISDLNIASWKMYKQVQHNTEELAAERDRANRANQAKSRFLSTMSHEIRTPLNGILGTAALLQKSDLNAEQRTHIDILASSGQHLLHIINDVLDMSKIEADELILEQVPFEMVALFQRVVNKHGPAAEEKMIDLVFDNQLDQSLPVVGDPTRLEQILSNLVDNAVKFTEDGSVTVRLDARRRNDEDIIDVMFSVKDTGIGIAADKAEAVFSSFTQAEDNTTRRFGGTGLGLSITREIIEKMGGEIKLDTAIGVGSTFCVNFSLPVDVEIEAHDVSDETEILVVPLKKTTPLSILVVEDVVVNAMIARAFLTDAGHTVAMAENGLKALAMVKEQTFDVILMDIHMPEMDGVEATRAIRKNSGIAQPVIIALTADAFVDNHRDYRQAGMDDILTKPFTAEHLQNMVQKHAGQAQGRE